MLKEELDQSTNVGIGVDYRPMLMRAINRSYAILLSKYTWPHLRVVSDRIALQAGERFYDFPDNIDYERVTDVRVWWGDKPLQVERGVAVGSEYAAFDPEDDGERSDPVLKWDTQWKDTQVQFEVWPVPASNAQQIQFTGITKTPRLVNDEDQCLLDDDMVVAFAAARILKKRKSPDADDALAEAREFLANAQKNTGPSERVRMGLGAVNSGDCVGRTTVRIAGS